MEEWGWDDRDDFCIRDVVSEDDVEKLRSYMRSYTWNPLEFARSLSMYHAVNIATAMVEGKLDERIDVNEYNLLHHAARMMHPELVQLFLSDGARTDIKLTIGLVGEWDKGLLPLDIALDATRSSEALRRWTLNPRDQSILNLIVTLCDPKMGNALACTKLIAGSSKNVEEEAYYCAMEGKLIDLAVLLIVAREKVLVPLTFPSVDGAGSTRRMTIRQCVEDQISGLSFEEIKLRREFLLEELTQVQRNIMVMRAVGLLLEVFEKAGSSIDEYRQSQKFKGMREQKEKDKKDLALRLEEAGFKIETRDFRFSITDCLNSHDTVGTPIEHLETPSGDSAEVIVLEMGQRVGDSERELGVWVLVWCLGLEALVLGEEMKKNVYSRILEVLIEEMKKTVSPRILEVLIEEMKKTVSPRIVEAGFKPVSSRNSIRTPIKSFEASSDKSSKIFNPGLPSMQQKDASFHTGVRRSMMVTFVGVILLFLVVLGILFLGCFALFSLFVFVFNLHALCYY